MDGTSTVKMVYGRGLEERRQLMSWNQNVHQTIRNLVITTEDAQDRDLWRTSIRETEIICIFAGEKPL